MEDALELLKFLKRQAPKEKPEHIEQSLEKNSITARSNCCTRFTAKTLL
jgi:hypothetical protein